LLKSVDVLFVATIEYVRTSPALVIDPDVSVFTSETLLGDELGLPLEDESPAHAGVEPRPDHDIIAARASTVNMARTGLRQAVHLYNRVKEVNFDIIGPLGMSLIA
jgi:hypothetical protein